MISKNNFFRNIPPVTLNLLIINVLFFLASDLFSPKFGVDLTNFLGLHFIKSSFFYPFQLISYMFMHANFAHLFFNMFGLFMFGRILEHFWGGKKFLLFYFIAGIGAGLIQEVVWYVQYLSIIQNISYADLLMVKNEGYAVLQNNQNYVDNYLGKLNILLHIPTVGASGAIFGVLFAFGFMFPKEKLMLIFLPIPIPARIFVIIYALLELFAGVANFSWDNIAHFAHLGGALFGLIMIFWWRKKGKLFNRQI